LKTTPHEKIIIFIIVAIIPHVYPLVPSGYGDSSSVTFGCLVSKYFPEPVTIAMGTTTGQTSSTVTIFPAVQLTDPNISYSRSSQLTVSSSDWSKNTYQCLVNHNSINFQKIIPKGKMYVLVTQQDSCLQYNINCLGINVFILGPTVEDLLVNKIAPLTCLASNLPSSTGYKFTWLQEGGGNLPFTTEDPTLNENGTYSVASVCSTTIDAWDKGTKYTCTLTYTGITSPFIKIISKGTVALFPPTSEEESSKEYVTYTCMASNFYPIDIYIGWSQDNQEIHKSLYVNSDPTWEVENASYFIVSKLKVPYEDWKENKAVSCVVGHKALPLHFIQRTIDKTTGKPTKTFVNIYMSDSNLSCP
uniref:Ig-like domain-containing protein n=1 Tax=Leptobrachium leishanense TaxID=445787 RepID=A0A8C5MBU3_9ANUR